MSAYVDQNHVPSFICIRFEGYGYCYAHKNNEGERTKRRVFLSDRYKKYKMNHINDTEMNMLDDRLLIVADRKSMIHFH